LPQRRRWNQRSQQKRRKSKIEKLKRSLGSKQPLSSKLSCEYKGMKVLAGYCFAQETNN